MERPMSNTEHESPEVHVTQPTLELVPEAPEEQRGAIGIALVVWLLGGGLGLALLVFLLAKIF